MPFRIDRIDRQRTVAGLAKSLYGRDASENVLAAGEAALLQANPFLGDRERIRSGAVVIVPEIDAITPPAPEMPTDDGDLRLNALLDRFQQAKPKRSRSKQPAVLADGRIAKALKEGRSIYADQLDRIAETMLERSAQQAKALNELEGALKQAIADRKILRSLRPPTANS